MKLRFTLISCLIVSICLAQSNKPIVDTSMIGTWPILQEKPIMSPDGAYVAYIISNQPRRGKTFVIQNIFTNWTKEFISNGITGDYFFSKDSKQVLWKDADTICSYDLQQDSLHYAFNTVAFKYPKNNTGVWIAYQTRGNPSLTLKNLMTGAAYHLEEPDEFFFNAQGSCLIIIPSLRTNSSPKNSLNWIDLSNPNKVNTIWTANLVSQKVSNFSFNNEGDQASFIVRDSKDSSSDNTIYYYKSGMPGAVNLNCVNKLAQSNLTLKSATPGFSRNSKWLFFDLIEKSKKIERQAGAVSVDIWSYKDEDVNPNQSSSNKNYVGVLNIQQNCIAYIQKTDEKVETSAEKITGDFILIKRNYRLSDINKNKWSCFLRNLNNQEEILLTQGDKFPFNGAYTCFSSNGRFLIFWNTKEAMYYSFDIERRKLKNLTKTLPPITRENESGIYNYPVKNVVGWFKNDSSILIYDQYDLWKIEVSGNNRPTNITNAYGRKHQIKLRLVYEKNNVGDDIVFQGNDTLLFVGFNTTNKRNGFYKKVLSQAGNPAELTNGPYTYYRVESQKPHYYSFWDGLQPIQSENKSKPMWLVQRCSDTEYFNYFVTGDFTRFRQITDFQPQKEYNWLTSELITWKQLDGTFSQGVLYKPENFDPRKKYPVIFNYYEQLSHRLFEFPIPYLASSNINIPWFVSRGYLVFTPDIHYSNASEKNGKTVGEAAYNSVVSAAKTLAKLKYVDSTRFAIQGHSFGGHQTSYLVTHSNVFAAASEMAGTNDLLTSNLTLVTISELPGAVERYDKQDIAESGQGRMGSSPWERPDLYRESSAIINANRTTTPLLIIHNKQDGAINWRQGVMLYMALRRLNKKCWMLQYDGEGHVIATKKNRLDYTIRLTQFFDHYLKDSLPPRWMTENTLAKYKGVENLYELDSDGWCGENCKVCKAHHAKQTTINKVSTISKTKSTNN